MSAKMIFLLLFIIFYIGIKPNYASNNPDKLDPYERLQEFERAEFQRQREAEAEAAIEAQYQHVPEREVDLHTLEERIQQIDESIQQLRDYRQPLVSNQGDLQVALNDAELQVLNEQIQQIDEAIEELQAYRRPLERIRNINQRLAANERGAGTSRQPEQGQRQQVDPEREPLLQEQSSSDHSHETKPLDSNNKRKPDEEPKRNDVKKQKLEEARRQAIKSKDDFVKKIEDKRSQQAHYDTEQPGTSGLTRQQLSGEGTQGSSGEEKAGGEGTSHQGSSGEGKAGGEGTSHQGSSGEGKAGGEGAKRGGGGHRGGGRGKYG